MEIEATRQEALSGHEAYVLSQLMYDARLSGKFTRTEGGTQTGPSGESFSQRLNKVLTVVHGITDPVAQQRISGAYFAAKQSNSPAVTRNACPPTARAFEIVSMPAGTNVKPSEELPDPVQSKALSA